MALVACSECHAQVSDKAISCPQCGNLFHRCPECGAELRQGATTCASCGYPLGLVPPPTAVSGYAAGLLLANTQHFGRHAAAVVYAGFWRRFAAAVIDAILVSVVVFVCDVALAVIFGSRSSLFAILSSAFGFAGMFAYYVGSETSRRQATLGKRALGIIVTDLEGDRISSGRAIGRYFGKVVSAILLGIGFLMTAFTAKKQALHDKMAGTLVLVKNP